MGFKEVMALRQGGNLIEALKLAREDYAISQDQWSASALFWVLKDMASEMIAEKNTSDASILIEEMEQIVGNMGATTNVAMEALAGLQREVVPYFNELASMADEIGKTKNRNRIKEIFLEVTEWFAEDEGSLPDEALHEDYAKVLYGYLDCYYQHITYEVFEEIYDKYLSLKNQRPSQMHSRFLRLGLAAKRFFAHRLDFSNLVAKWDLSKLTSKDWERGKISATEISKSLAEEVLFEVSSELVVKEESAEVPQEVQQLLVDALIAFPEDEVVQLVQARMIVKAGDQKSGLERYEQILQDIEVPMAWAEYAFLVEGNDELRMAALSMALREEKNEYQVYLTKTRLELARILIDRELYSSALRELALVAQICLEKSFELPERHQMLMQKIPANTEQNKENKELYYQWSRPVLAHIFRAIPDIIVMVYDVMAMRLKEENQVVPMLKLITPQGKTSLVTPKEAGVLPGDNRGRIYEVKLQERHRKHTRVVLLTLRDDIDPLEEFPTQVGIINGYSESMHAYHVMDSNSRHHYLNGSPNEYMQGEFIKFVILTENQQRKNQPPTPPREYIYHVERINPQEAILIFDPIKARVEQVRGDNYYLRTERGIPSVVNQSVAPVELEPGENIIIRGFQQRYKDRNTGQVTYSFVTLAIEPYFE